MTERATAERFIKGAVMKINAKKLLSNIARDESITKAEAKRAAKQIKRGGVSKSEKAAVRSALNLYADSFERGAKAPLKKLVSSASAASTGTSGISPISNAINSDMGKAFGDGYSLTADQAQMLKDAGLKPGSQEYKQQELQLKIANYTNKMNAVTNIGKMLTDLSASIVRNVRS